MKVQMNTYTHSRFEYLEESASHPFAAPKIRATRSVKETIGANSLTSPHHSVRAETIPAAPKLVSKRLPLIPAFVVGDCTYTASTFITNNDL